MRDSEFKKYYLDCAGKRLPWYLKYFKIFPRAWTDGVENVYINTDAFYINERDHKLVVLHEDGHISGKKHTLFGVMSAYGLIRFLTSG